MIYKFILTSLKPDGVILCYLKLRLSDQQNSLRSTTLGWQDYGIGKSDLVGKLVKGGGGRSFPPSPGHSKIRLENILL